MQVTTVLLLLLLLIIIIIIIIIIFRKNEGWKELRKVQRGLKWKNYY